MKQDEDSKQEQDNVAVVSKITLTLTVGQQEIKLSLAEARALQRQLNEMLGNNDGDSVPAPVVVPVSPVVIERHPCNPYSPYPPYYPSVTWHWQGDSISVSTTSDGDGMIPVSSTINVSATITP